MAKTLAVIVAGGKGSRLGLGVPKAMARVGGLTLIERALRAVEPWCDAIVVAAPPAIEFDESCYRRIEDAAGPRSPLAGVVGGFESVAHERAFVLGADFPLVEPATILAILDRLSDRSAVIPMPGGIPQPLAAAYSARAESEMAARFRAGEHSVILSVMPLDPSLVPDQELAEWEGGTESFLNVNTAEDLARAESVLASRERARGAV